jgi:hypothetical protein
MRELQDCRLSNGLARDLDEVFECGTHAVPVSQLYLLDFAWSTAMLLGQRFEIAAD